MIHCRTLLLLAACVPVFGQQYTISTIAGASFPTSVAVDSAGNVYFGDWYGIKKIWPGGGVTTVAGQFGMPIGLAISPSGILYFADENSNLVGQVNLSSGIVSTVAGTGAGVDSGDGGLAVSAGVRMPSGVALDAAGNLYFGSSWSRIREVDARTGMIRTIAGQFANGYTGDGGPALGARFWDPIPSAVSRNGDLYIADFQNSRIRKMSLQTGIVTTVVGSGDCPIAPGPFRITVCRGAYDGDAGPGTNASLNYAEGVALDDSGNLYIADTINHRIRRLDAKTGLIYTIAGNGVRGYFGDGGPALAAEISTPAGIAVDSSGRVYIADEGNNCIRMLTPVATQSDELREPHSR
ncbi:MAG: hypothetical protein LAP40_12325 [Acidobacteriia bacterium]|nr:hypothetical protein [Terriglobia bacterium]